MSKTLGSLPVGAKIKFGEIYGNLITWVIADKNHEGYPDNSVTLITEKIIKLACIDAKEASNSDNNRKNYGNNRYLYSNARQWLNGSAAAGSWYTKQHSADAPPTAANCWDRYNPYDTAAGFLNGFTQQERDALLTTTLTVGKAQADGGGTETITDKVFYLSCTEVGLSGDAVCGAKLAIFSDNNSRIAYPTQDCVTNSTYTNNDFTASKAWHWWLRDACASYSYTSCFVLADGTLDRYYTCSGLYGARPACNVSSDLLVSDEPDSDGAYRVDFGQLTLNDMHVSETVKIRENGTAVDYLIVHKGLPSDMYDASCDGVWLLRQQAHSYQVWEADNKNDYENSDIKSWLNGTFLNTIDEKIRAAIKTVKIPFKKGVGNASTPVQSGSSGLSCKVFLLSGYEVGFTTTDNEHIPIDGAKLSYFSDNNSRIAKDSDSVVTWWLRSPLTRSDISVWHVRSDGTYYNGHANSTGYAARPAFVLPSTLLVDSDGFVSTNTLPIITSDKVGNLGMLEDGFVCNYSVDDADAADTVTISLYMDDTQISTFEAVKGQQYTYSLTGAEWLKITNGTHTFKIAATDGKDTVESTATFTRNCSRLSTTLSTPLPVDDSIVACSLKVAGSIPADAVCLFEVTNNANDPEPVWEDCTAKSKSGLSHIFQNKTAANGFAFNFRISIERGASGEIGYITQISGGFE